MLGFCQPNPKPFPTGSRFHSLTETQQRARFAPIPSEESVLPGRKGLGAPKGQEGNWANDPNLMNGHYCSSWWLNYQPNPTDMLWLSKWGSS